MQNFFINLSIPNRISGFEQHREKSGMALIIVMGVLSVMLIMAISFSIVMRTERVASANRNDDVRVRQLLNTALARAAADIAAEFNGQPGKLGQVYPTWLALASTNNFTIFNFFAEDFTNPVAYAFIVQDTNVFTNIGLLYELPDDFLVRAGGHDYEQHFKNEMTNYVPGALWNAAMTENTRIYWQPVAFAKTLGYSPGGSARYPFPMTTMVGRVSYIILNCSGLWDANYVGGLDAAGTPIARGLGTNVNEVAISNSPEIGTNLVGFIQKRTDAVRYESLYDLHQQNLTNLLLPKLNFPENLFVYSRCLTGALTNIPQTNIAYPVWLGGDEAYLTNNSTLIMNAFRSAGFSLPESQLLYTNLLDYVDTNNVPRSLTLPTVEPVPMINEIKVTSIGAFEQVPPAPAPAASYNYYLTNSVIVEVWTPFLTKLPSQCSNVMSIIVSCPKLGSPVTNITTQTVSCVPNAFTVITNSFVKTANFLSTISPPFAADVLVISRVMDGATVDEVQMNVSLTPFALNVGDVQRREVLDPRFNHDSRYWRNAAAPGTLGAMNAWPQTYLGPTNDGTPFMYVANTNMRVVGELGYLLYSTNQPWKTLCLYSQEHARVFNHFTTMQSPSGSPVVTNRAAGFFNPNSMNAEALAYAFVKMPVDQYPLQPGATLLSLANAGWIATNLIKFSQLPPPLVRAFTNLSDVVTNMAANWSTIANDIPACVDEPTREALVRNSMGLFNVRQNVFEILLAAEIAGVDGRFPLRPMRARAVAIVWRDPYTGGMFVRSVRILQD